MNPFETPSAPKKPDDKKADSDWFVGAKKNPDGSWDYSRALRFTDPNTTKELDAAADKMDQKKVAERKEKLKIPDHVKPGTASMVFENLRNAIFLNEETIEKSRAQGKPVDERIKSRLEKLKDQQKLLLETPQGIYMSEDSALRTEDYIENRVKSFYEREKKRLIDEQSAGTLSSKDKELGMIEHYNESLRIAEELQRRLIDEAAKKGQPPKHESPKTPGEVMPPPEKKEARVDSEYFSAVSRYFNGRKDALREISATPDPDNELYGEFLTEQQYVLLKLANPKKREKMQPIDVSFALAELSGVMANTNPENLHVNIADDEETIQEYEKIYLDTRTVYMESCQKMFPDTDIDFSPSELILQLRKIKKVDLHDIGGTDENPMVEVMSVSETQKLMKEDPQELLRRIDEVLYWVGDQMKHAALNRFELFYGDNEIGGDMDSVKKEEIRLGTLAEPMYKLQLFKDELLKKVYGNSDMKPSERMKVNQLFNQLGHSSTE